MLALTCVLWLLCSARDTATGSTRSLPPIANMELGLAFEDPALLSNGSKICAAPAGHNASAAAAATGGDDEEDVALVSFFIAQAYSDRTDAILAPVPCLSRITLTHENARDEGRDARVFMTALITHRCVYCRNKFIRLSPSAFAKLAQPNQQHAKDTNVSTEAIRVFWRIDVLEPQNGSGLQTFASEEEMQVAKKELERDLDYEFHKSVATSTLALNEPCNYRADGRRAAVIDGDWSPLFKNYSSGDSNLAWSLMVRHKLEWINRMPGQFCQLYEDMGCAHNGTCQCQRTSTPSFSCSGNYSCANCIDDTSEPIVCMLDLGNQSSQEKTCPEDPDLCTTRRDGQVHCIAEYRKQIKNEIELQSDMQVMQRFPAPRSGSRSDCVCMNKVLLETFAIAAKEIRNSLRKSARTNFLDFGSHCDTREEEVRGGNAPLFNNLDRRIPPAMFLHGPYYVTSEFSARVNLVLGFRISGPLCKRFERLSCNSSGLCDCYANPAQNVTFVAEEGVCVLTRHSICDPAFWGGRFDNYVDDYSEDAVTPECLRGLLCVDMSTGKLCPRDSSFFSVSLRYKVFPFLHEDFKREDPTAFDLKAADFCRCHEIFDVGGGGPSLWLLVTPPLGLALAFLGMGTALWYRHRMLNSKKNFLLKLSELERRLFLEGHPEISEGSDVQQGDGGVRAQFLPYDREAWEIAAVDVECGEQLGDGGFGVVHKGTLRRDRGQSHTPVAIKKCRDVNDLDAIRSLLVEIKIFSYIGQQHRNVVGFLGAITADAEAPELILELCEHGSLVNVFRDQLPYFLDRTLADIATGTGNYGRVWTFCTSDLLCWAWQVASGMEFLGTERAIIHGDLFLRNVLLDTNGVAKITDFGLARRFIVNTRAKPYIRVEEGCFPLTKLLPPEARTEPRKLSPALDVWTYGVLLWEMFSLGCSEPDCSSSAEELSEPAHATSAVCEIMRLCWAQDPAHRIGFGKLKDQIRYELGEGTDPETHRCDFSKKYLRM